MVCEAGVSEVGVEVVGSNGTNGHRRRDTHDLAQCLRWVKGTHDTYSEWERKILLEASADEAFRAYSAVAKQYRQLHAQSIVTAGEANIGLKPPPMGELSDLDYDALNAAYEVAEGEVGRFLVLLDGAQRRFDLLAHEVATRREVPGCADDLRSSVSANAGG